MYGLFFWGCDDVFCLSICDVIVVGKVEGVGRVMFRWGFWEVLGEEMCVEWGVEVEFELVEDIFGDVEGWGLGGVNMVE